MPSNIEAAQIYLLNSGQRIMAGMAGETIDIDNNAIFRSMDAYPGEIRDKWACIKKVRATFHHFLNIERKKREADS